MSIPFIVAFATSAFVAGRLIKAGEDSKGLIVGFAVAVFVVAISITHTIVFIPFGEILKLMAGGLIPAGLFAGLAFLGKGEWSDKLGRALGVIVVIMFVWLIAIGFVAGGRGDYNDCRDAGPQGMYTVCD